MNNIIYGTVLNRFIIPRAQMNRAIELLLELINTSVSMPHYTTYSETEMALLHLLLEN